MGRHKAKNFNGAGRLTVTLAPGQREKLETIARENQVSLAFVTRQMLSDFINVHRDGRLRLSFTPAPKEK